MNVIEFSIKALDNFSANMDKFHRGLTKTEKAFAALGLTAAAYAAVRSVKASLDNAEAMGVAAQKANMATEQFSALAWAAKMSNVEQGSLTTGLKLLGRALAEGDATPAGKALGFLGVSATDANGRLRPTIDVLMDVADGFKNAKDDANKTKTAMELFGRSGVDMVPMLNQGSEAIREMMEDAKKLGIVISDDFAASANQVNDNLDTLAQVIKGSVNVAMAQVSPVIEQITGQFIQFATEGDNVAKVGESIAAGLRVVMTAVVGVSGAFKTMGEWLGGVFAASGNFKEAFNILKITVADAEKNVTVVAKNIADVWDKGAQSVAGSEAKKMTALRKAAASLKNVEHETKAAKEAQEAYAETYKQLTDLLKAAQTPEEAHIARLEAITDLQKKLGGTSKELTAAIARENEEWEHTELSTQRYKDSVTGVMATTTRLIKDDLKQVGNATYQMSVALKSAFKTLSKGIGDSIGDAIVNGSSLQDSMESIGKNIAVSLISAFVQAQIAGVVAGTAVNTAWLPWAAAIIVLKLLLDEFGPIVIALGAVAVAVGLAVSAAWAIPGAVILVIIAAVLILKKLFEEFGILGVIFAPLIATFYVLKAVVELVSDAVKSLFSTDGGIFSSMLDGVLSAFRAILDVIRAIVDAAKNIIGGGGGIIGNILGGAGNLIGGAVSSIGSMLGFAGGGFTGYGSRSGGLDGQGGFLAMLHPQETVIDHVLDSEGTTRGSTGAGGTQGLSIQSVTIHVLENAINVDAFAHMDKMQLRAALGQPIIDALNEMTSIGVRPNFATENR